MDKTLNEVALRVFTQAVLSNAAWVSTRSKAPALGGAAVLERRFDRDTAVWLSFGGLKHEHRLFGLFGGWTREGSRYSRLDLLDGPGPDGTWPATGLVDLRDVACITGSSHQKFAWLEMPPPPEALQRAALDAYLASAAYATWLDKAVAFESRRKQAPTREQIDAETRLSEATFMTLWGHLLERLPSAAEQAAAVMAPVVDAALALLAQHGMPFLSARVGRDLRD